MTERRFYIKEGYHWQVWDRRAGAKAAVVRANVLYPADDFASEKSAQRHADRLEALVATARKNGATLEQQDLYWQYLD